MCSLARWSISDSRATPPSCCVSDCVLWTDPSVLMAAPECVCVIAPVPVQPVLSLYLWQLRRQLGLCEGSRIDRGQALIGKTSASSRPPFRTHELETAELVSARWLPASGQNVTQSQVVVLRGTQQNGLAGIHSD